MMSYKDKIKKALRQYQLHKSELPEQGQSGDDLKKKG
jgi:hypothetical protein